MGNSLLKLILTFEQDRDQLHYIDDMVANTAATAEAIERVLGAPSNTLYRPDAEAIKGWLALLE